MSTAQEARRIARASNIQALRRAIAENRNAPAPGKFDRLRAELLRLETAEQDDHQGIEDAPIDLLDPGVLA